MSSPSSRGITSPSSVSLMHEDKESANSDIWSNSDIYTRAKITKIQRARYVFKVFWGFLPCLLLLSVLILNWKQYQKRGPSNPLFPQLVYSPVQDLLEYEVRKFHLGFDPDLTEYQGQPSPEIDERWLNLYRMGVTHIPIEEARKLPNKTTIFPHHEEEGYLMELDVFHQLHCLVNIPSPKETRDDLTFKNMIRHALSPEHYKGYMPGLDGEDELLGFHHINHCVDAIRQSLMCSVDVSVLTWRWDETKQINAERGTILHTCRNFDKIRDWAWEHAITDTFDMDYHVRNDPLDNLTWINGYRGE